jgi:hypothetical protein
MPERRGQHKKSHDATFQSSPILSDLGITKSDSSRYQAIAAVPKEEFEEEYGGNGRIVRPAIPIVSLMLIW